MSHLHDPSALSPALSVWVNASAGSGKTHLLTQRVVRLLMEREAASSILCITFTKAGAAEMRQRIDETLAFFASAPRQEVLGSLQNLLQHAPTEEEFLYARRLFYEVLEDAVGIQIQTIHGFCESLLRRFPMEAGLSPHFQVMDEPQAAHALVQSRQAVSLAQGEYASLVEEALDMLTCWLDTDQLDQAMREMLAAKRHIQRFLEHEGGLVAALDAVYAALGLERGASGERLRQEWLAEVTPAEQLALRDMAGLLAQGSEADGALAASMVCWCDGLATGRLTDGAIARYSSAWMTAAGTPRLRLASAAMLKRHPELGAQLMQEQSRVVLYHRARQDLQCAQMNEQLLYLCGMILHHYAEYQTKHACIDYDGVIDRAVALLEHTSFGPVALLGLQSHIRHILLDESQDTSEAQWQVMGQVFTHCTMELPEGRSLHHSVFVVGDEKQSIFGFQGADPGLFETMRSVFAEQLETKGRGLHVMRRDQSFRSAPPILAYIDALFAQDPVLLAALSPSGAVAHHPVRDQAVGMVTLWPLMQEVSKPKKSKQASQEPTAEKEDDSWKQRLSGEGVALPSDSPVVALAERIASTIALWLRQGRWLVNHQRPVSAGDIFILVRKRGPLVGQLHRALHAHQVPVAGQDRLEILQHIAVQDLLALCQWLLLPSDDMHLAIILRSAIGNLSEEMLYELAAERPEGCCLWDALQASQHSDAIQLAQRLKQLQHASTHQSIFTWMVHVLEVQGCRRRFVARHREEVHDILDSFLGMVEAYEASMPASLQGFIPWMTQHASVMSRCMQHIKGAVRIMTVHGSKGLQAPIVFVADMDTVPKASKGVLWARHGAPMLLWSPRTSDAPAAYGALQAQHDAAHLQEYWRLLYVALSRAEDALFLCGAGYHEACPERSWYAHARRAMDRVGGEHQEEGAPEEVYGSSIWAMPSCLTEGAVEGVTAVSADVVRLPAWAEPEAPSAEQEEGAQQEANVTQLVWNEGALRASSPLEAGHHLARLRGTFIHQWLERLPVRMREGSSPKCYEAEMLAWGSSMRLPENLLRETIQQVIGLLEHPNMQALFGPGSMGEYRVAGWLVASDGQRQWVHGVIDRILITQHTIHLVEIYSSLEPASEPEEAKMIPEPYRQQMECYVALLRQQYPTHLIRASLLWSHSAELVELMEVLPEVYIKG